MSTTMQLSDMMIATRQRADMMPAGYTPSLSGNTTLFVPDQELISYINQSRFELYDLLVTTFEDYFVASPLQFSTTGAQMYPLPDGTSSYYPSSPVACLKVLGVDLGLSNGNNAFVTLQRFDFISRNRYVFPQITSTFAGVFNLRYRILGSNLMFIPTPASGQIVQLWYVPRLTQLVNLTDTDDGISGWNEYVITDAAIKCGQKEETDVSVLLEQKAALIKRINDSAQNRDIGAPQTISDTKTRAQNWGQFGGVGFDGSYGGS